MAKDDGGRALDACVRYATIATEIDRLTHEITFSECPNESPSEPETHWWGNPSCFEAAKEVDVPQTYEDMPHSRKRTLDEIEVEVADCESCTRLVGLIRKRRHEKRRLGAAKRWIRKIGTTMLSQEADE